MSIAESAAPATGAEVFVSYSRKDSDHVIPILDELESAGVSVWRDRDRILGGEKFDVAISHAIAKSKVILLMCSSDSYASEHVMQEVRLAFTKGPRKAIPLLLKQGLEFPPVGIDYWIPTAQCIDIAGRSKEQWLPEVIAALTNLGVRIDRAPADTPIGSGPKAAIPPAEPEPPKAPLTAPATGGPKPAEPEIKLEPAKPDRLHIGARPIPGVDLELRERLGVGGFGEVWKAINPHVPHMKPVALKFCLDPEAQAILRHEAATVAQVLRHVKRHAGVVGLLHTYLSADPPALEYEYVSGGNLSDHIHSAMTGIGTLPWHGILKIMRRLADIVAFAHQADPPIVHRDLKPSNVLVETKGPKLVLRISDFGIGGIAASRCISVASKSGDKDNRAEMLRGAHTPLYASPQQIAGECPDPRDDVHALGVIWYQLLVGDTKAGAPRGREWVDALRKRKVPAPAIDLLNSCIEEQPKHRPANAAVLHQRLVAIDDEPAKAKPERKPVPPDPEPKKPDSETGGGPDLGGRPSGFPRVNRDGATELKCRCGKIKTVAFASGGDRWNCELCAATNRVPDSWGVREHQPKPDAKSKSASAHEPLPWGIFAPGGEAPPRQQPGQRGHRGFFGRWAARFGFNTAGRPSSKLRWLMIGIGGVVLVLGVLWLFGVFTKSPPSLSVPKNR